MEVILGLQQNPKMGNMHNRQKKVVAPWYKLLSNDLRFLCI